MSVKSIKVEKNVNYFCTFTNFQWLPLFELTHFYDGIFKWFDLLKQKGIRVCGFVIMPNHLHCLIFLPEGSTTIDKIIGNAKRFMAYEIVKRLEVQGDSSILNLLEKGVSEKEKISNHKHKVFQPSFDAIPCYTYKFLHQKLNYMHQNPVRKCMVNFAEEYKYSSAEFYLTGKQGIYPVTHYLYTLGEMPYEDWLKNQQ
ncbi:MAG: hypothetical protein IPG60_14140 [Bacteroidetes bacterium]|nr:hypothetical protein [Bacteroidota bacterium]